MGTTMRDDEILNLISKLYEIQVENNKKTMETIKTINKHNCIRDIVIVVIVLLFLLILYCL